MTDTERQAGEALARGRACFAAAEWLEAHRLLLQADALGPLQGADLERLGEAAYLIGAEDEALEHFERAHRSHLQAGAVERAARYAFWLGMHSIFRGDMGRASGWFGRAGRLLEDRGEVVERGYLLLPGVHQRMAAGEIDAAAELAVQARELGQKHGDAELVAIAMHLQGRALLSAGRLDAGLSLLDETMVAVVGGELSARVAGLIYCSVIEGCHEVCAVDRAAEWTQALTRFCERQPTMQAFTGKCLLHRAEILQLQGQWQGAVAEAQRVCERFARGTDRESAGAAFYQQGEVHRMRGDLQAAEQAYLRAGEVGSDPQPGLSLLRLSQGKAQAAVTALSRALLSARAPLARARLLPAQVEVLLAAGQGEPARQACDELEAIAARFDTDAIVGLARQARGALQLQAGNAVAALPALDEALARFQRAEMPYQVARTRVLLARACAALDDTDGEAMQQRAARAAFEELGAGPAPSDAGGGEPRPAGGAGEHGLSARELEVLALVASGQTNREIAGALSLSVKTIDRHVSNILTKLDVPSRAAATAYAYEHGLL